MSEPKRGLQYKGRLYGHVGNDFFPLAMTSVDVDRIESELTQLRAERDRMQVELNRWRELAVHHERESAEWERRSIVANGQVSQLLRKAQSKRSNQRDRFIVPAPSHESPTISSPEIGVAHRKQEDSGE